MPKSPQTRILPGSAIVGTGEIENGHTLVYFEDNRYGAGDLQRFIMRCLHAHDRMVQHYPTIAKAVLPVDGLLQVGTYRPAEGQVVVEKPADLAAWLGVSELDPNELTRPRYDW